MIYKVHWIVDGVAEIDAKTKEEAEKILKEDLEAYVTKPLISSTPTALIEAATTKANRPKRIKR